MNATTPAAHWRWLATTLHSEPEVVLGDLSFSLEDATWMHVIGVVGVVLFAFYGCCVNYCRARAAQLEADVVAERTKQYAQKLEKLETAMMDFQRKTEESVRRHLDEIKAHVRTSWFQQFVIIITHMLTCFYYVHYFFTAFKLRNEDGSFNKDELVAKGIVLGGLSLIVFTSWRIRNMFADAYESVKRAIGDIERNTSPEEMRKTVKAVLKEALDEYFIQNQQTQSVYRRTLHLETSYTETQSSPRFSPAAPPLTNHSSRVRSRRTTARMSPTPEWVGHRSSKPVPPGRLALESSIGASTATPSLVTSIASSPLSEAKRPPEARPAPSPAANPQPPPEAPEAAPEPKQGANLKQRRRRKRKRKKKNKSSQESRDAKPV